MSGTRARSRVLQDWAVWTAGFLAFPLGGVLGSAVAGRVDDQGAALVGGLLTGLVVGAGQALAARGRLAPARWVPATAAGTAVGLALGAAVVGFRTGLPDLALMGLLTGLPLGVAQALALPPQWRRRWVWALATPLLWGLGWTITTLAGVDVEAQYTIFGSTGAATVSALSGAVLHLIGRRSR